jgi:outer membrane protein OmpA-like peptidoglycan-associated protein
MKHTSQWILALTIALCIACASAYGKDAVEIKGMIIERGGDGMTVRAMDGTTYTVVLTDYTKVQVPKGLGLRKKQMSWTNLIPGLRVGVKGDNDIQGRLVAHEVNFTNEDLRTAAMIQAGLDPTMKRVGVAEENIAANKEAIGTNQEAIATNKQQIETNQEAVNQRFASLADYDTKDRAVVYFAVGKSTISEQDKQALSQLAARAANTPGYLIQVKGFADSSGNPAMNQSLSKTRAEAVVAYLMQACNIAPRHILSPGAMGISNPASSNETKQGRAENRRVEVLVIVNKGVAGA